MATGNQTTTTAAQHIDDVYVEGVIRAMEFSLVIAQNVDHGWDFVGHGDTYIKVRIPNIEVQTKSASTDLNATVYTDTAQSISINTHQACAIKHEDIAQLLSRNDVKEEMTRKMGYSLGRAVDTNLAALFQSFSQIVGTLGQEWSFDELLSAAQYLELAGYDLGSDVVWLVSTQAKYGLMKMDQFAHADYRGSSNAQNMSEKGTVGKFMNAPVISTQLTRSPASGQHESALFHKEMVALIMAENQKTTVERLALGLADVVVTSNIYGYGEVDKYSETPGNITATDEGAVLLRGV